MQEQCYKLEITVCLQLGKIQTTKARSVADLLKSSWG